MALKYSGKFLINGTEVFAMTENITTTSYNVAKGDPLAADLDDGTRTLKIIKAGTPVPANDGTCIGLVFENWDVTDTGGPVPIVLSGNVNEHYAPVTYSSECKAALKNISFMGSGMFTAAKLFLSAEPTVQKDSYAHATGCSITVTVTGTTFTDEAKDKINWILGLPAGWYLDSVTKSSATVCVLVIKNTNASYAPTGDEQGSIDATADCFAAGSQPAGQISKLLKT